MAGHGSQRQPTTTKDMLRRMQKDSLYEARRSVPRTASDLLGPGLASRAIRTMDWNADELAFNGLFYSEPGAQNSPDVNRYWMGIVEVNPDGFGYQRVLEYRVLPWPDQAPDEWIRTFSTTGLSRTYSAWHNPARTPFAVLTKSDNQALTSGALTTLSFDGSYGDADMLTTPVNRLVVTRDGYWQVEAGFGWPALAGGTRGAFIYWHDLINNVDNIIGSYNAGTTNTALSAEVVTFPAREVPVLAGDYFFVRSIQSSGSPSTTSSSNGNQFLQARWHRPV